MLTFENPECKGQMYGTDAIQDASLLFGSVSFRMLAV